MRVFLNIANTGLVACLLHPGRSAVTVTAVVAVLVPYLAGVGLAEGLREQAAVSVSDGADLVVSGEQFGRPAPVPVAAVDAIRSLPGVAAAVPRIVGRIEVGADRVSALVVGLPRPDVPATDLIEGRLFGDPARPELVIGSDIARSLRLRVGSHLPPFYHSRQGERVSEVVGVLGPDGPPWQSRLILTSFENAAAMFDQPGLATDVLVTSRPGYEDQVRTAIMRMAWHEADDAGPRPRIVGRDELAHLVPEGTAYREGVLTLISTVAFGVAVLVLLVTSGYGLQGRRRDVGILKATGWQTDEVLLRALTESVVLGVVATAVAVILAAVWLELFNGWGIAEAFFPGIGQSPAFRVPFRLLPTPVLVAGIVAQAVISVGTLYTTWRAAIAVPREAMR